MDSQSAHHRNGPYLTAIEVLRSKHGADIVIYWRMENDGGYGENGVGAIGGGGGVPGDGSEAYVHLTCECGGLRTTQ